MVAHKAPASLVHTGCLLCVAALAGCSGSAGADKNASPSTTAEPSSRNADSPQHNYNVLLVTLDTTRADYLGCYDAAQAALTPNLDALAGDAVRFDFAIAQASATPVSHASILTGLNPYEHGVRVISADAGYKLSPETPTLTTVLKAHGWATAAFLSSFTVSEYYGFDHGFDTFDSGLERDVSRPFVRDRDGYARWSIGRCQRRSDVTTDRALAWLTAMKHRPFFLWVHYWDPHDWLVLPPLAALRRFVREDLELGSPEWKRAIYQAEVHFMDEQFGRLIAALRAAGQYDRTIIVVVADHGEGLGDHDWWVHRLLYQEQLHVPMIVRVPGWPVGRVVPELVRTVDLFPTVLEALGLAARPGLAGTNLRSLVAGEAEPPRVAYAEMLNQYDFNAVMLKERPKDRLLYCMMDRTWKLIVHYGSPGDDELYNLFVDPRESKNLFDSEPERAHQLQAQLDDLHSYATGPLGTGQATGDALKALHALGYVGGTDDREAGEPNSAGPTSRPVPQSP